MEDRPWTKSEFFAWNDGRRIVDLYELSKQLHCKQCSSVLDLQRTERETRFGLASVLYVLCNCGMINDVHTGRLQHDGGQKNSSASMYEVNIKASINLLMYGVGASRILNFLALLDIPVPPPDDTSLIVPVSEDAEVDSTPLPLPPSSTASTTPAAPQRGVPVPETSSFQNSSSGFGPESSFSSVPHPTSSRDDDGNDNTTPVTDSQMPKDVNLARDDVLNEVCDDSHYDEAGDDYEVEEDDDLYVPPSKSKLRVKTMQAKASPRKNVRKAPKTTRAKKTSKLIIQKRAEKFKIKEENETPDEDENTGNKSREEEKDFANPMDWSTTESEPARDSDASWHDEEDDDGEDDEIRGTRKRKRGRPKGAQDKKKRNRKGSAHGKSEATAKRVKVSEDLPKCTTCPKEFNSIKGYNLHMKRVHNQEMKEAAVIPGDDWDVIQEEVTSELFRCILCPSVYAAPATHRKHIRTHHPESVETEKDSYHPVPLKDAVTKKKYTSQQGTEVTMYHCCGCDLRFDRLAILSKHLRISADGKATCMKLCPDGTKINGKTIEKVMSEKSLLCTTCGKSFDSHKQLMTHMKYWHKKKTIHACPICKAEFQMRNNLNQHMEIHDPQRPRSYVCDICAKGFFTRSGLRYHIIRFHERIKRFRCPICTNLFWTKEQCSRHMIIHTKVSKFSCDECGQTFTRQCNLDTHKRIHTGVKPYQCSLCPAAFAQKNSLNVHMKKHGIDIKKPRKSVDEPELIPADTVTIPCPLELKQLMAL